MDNDKKLMNVNVKSFIGALLMLLVLMILTYVLTFILPSGTYVRVMQGGSSAIVPGTYTEIAGGITFWKWLASPILVLFADGGGTIIAIIAFLLVIGGVFTSLDTAGVLSYMLGALHHRFEKRKYALLFLTCLFFMALGALVGSFEECVPLVPIAAALAYCMGWDALVGLGMSILCVGCGFATGVCNPFTVGVAQGLVGLPMFSGLSMRIVSFIVIYPIVSGFIYAYAKKIEKNPEKSLVYDAAAREKHLAMQEEFVVRQNMKKALIAFCSLLGAGLCCVFLSPFISFLQDLIMPIFALFFLMAGITSCVLCGMNKRVLFRSFKDGVMSILPAVLLILMASSVRYTLQEAKILDTLLHIIVSSTENASRASVVLLIYLLVLVMNFFIASGSAKAFLLMPLIAPLADLAGISRQIAVLAFAFGDGFSNVFYPTNPVLLISLSLAGVSYGKWAKWSSKIQIAILAATSLLLILANAIGY